AKAICRALFPTDPRGASYSMKLTSPKNSRPMSENSRIRQSNRLECPPSSKRRLSKWLLLALLAAGSFGVTYALVTRTRDTGAKPSDAPPGMAWIPGGTFTMGTDSELGWPDEKPAHRVRVDGFWMDETDVTNAQFREFVEATGYVTTAEKPVDVEEIL